MYLNVYRYLDAPSIDSLHAQLTDRVEVELRTTRDAHKSAAGKATVGVGELLRALLGFGGDVEISAGIAGGHTKEVVEKMSTEQKLNALLVYLSAGEDEYFTDFDVAADHAILTGRNVFVHGRDYFNLPQFIGGQDGPRAVAAAGMVFFERGTPPGATPTILDDPYVYADNYYKHPTKPRIIMSASIPKFTRANAAAPLSHDMLFFRSYGGLRVPIEVFGQLVPFPQGFAQIKPFAIW